MTNYRDTIPLDPPWPRSAESKVQLSQVQWGAYLLRGYDMSQFVLKKEPGSIVPPGPPSLADWIVLP